QHDFSLQPDRGRPLRPMSIALPLAQAGRTMQSLAGVAVQALAQLLAGLEERHEFLPDRHRRAGAWIAARPWGAMLDREGAEAPKLDPVAPGKSLHDLFEDHIDDALDVAMEQMRIRRSDLLYKFGLDHSCLAPQ